MKDVNPIDYLDLDAAEEDCGPPPPRFGGYSAAIPFSKLRGALGGVLSRSVTIWHPYLWRQVTGEVREIVQVLHADDRDDFVRVLDYSEGATYSRLYLDGWPGEILDPERQISRVLRLRRRALRRLPSPALLRGRTLRG